MLGDNNATIIIPVKDLEAAKKFYTEVVGLKPGKENGGGISFKSGDTSVFVYQTSLAGTNQATAASWVVADVKATVEALKGQGVTFEQYDSIPDVKREGEVHIKDDLQAAWFKDPDGNILNIVNMAG